MKLKKTCLEFNYLRIVVSDEIEYSLFWPNHGETCCHVLISHAVQCAGHHIITIW